MQKSTYRAATAAKFHTSTIASRELASSVDSVQSHKHKSVTRINVVCRQRSVSRARRPPAPFLAIDRKASYRGPCYSGHIHNLGSPELQRALLHWPHSQTWLSRVTEGFATLNTFTNLAVQTELHMRFTEVEVFVVKTTSKRTLQFWVVLWPDSSHYRVTYSIAMWW